MMGDPYGNAALAFYMLAIVIMAYGVWSWR